MDKDPSTELQAPSLLKRLLQILGFDRTLGTAEDLDQEIQELIDDGEEQGLISHHEGQMIFSILEFRDTVAREIMTPRSEMVSVAADTSYNDLIELIIDKGFSRIPVYTDNPDNITGILYAKDLLKYVNSEEKPVAGDITRPAFLALENRKIIDLLRDFQAKKVHITIISDEFGSVRGLATLEDVLEEIVGEITDESDNPENGWHVLNEQTIIADAKINLEEVEDFFKTDLPDGPYESIGGLIIHQLGHLPGANTIIEVNNLYFQVLAATHRRILKVKVTRETLK